MSKYFVKYEKHGKAQYISHLDFLRTIGRAMRRANLPLKYSEGFNPHPLISFAAPISVGITSNCEMLCVQLTQEVEPGEFAERLNAVLAPCIRIADVTLDNIDFTAIACADYEITTEIPVTEAALKAFMAQDAILIDKKTKKGIKETDIKVDIFSISVKDNIITATLKTSDNGSLKPMLLVSAMNMREDCKTGFCRYKRLRFRDADNNAF